MASEEKGNLFSTKSFPDEEPEEGEIQDDSLEDVSSEDDNDCVKDVRQNSVWYSTRDTSKSHHHLRSQGRTNLNFTRNKSKHLPSRGIQENKGVSVFFIFREVYSISETLVYEEVSQFIVLVVMSYHC